MNVTKMAAVVLTGTLAVSSMAMPVWAITGVPAGENKENLIDTSMTGSITIHKLKENEGTTGVGTGQEQAEFAGETGMEGIEFKALKLADIGTVNVDGTLGLYFSGLDAGYASLLSSLGISLPSVQETLSDGTEVSLYDPAAFADAFNTAETSPSGDINLTDLVDNSAGAATVVTDVNGTAVFTPLPLGVYLVCETDDSGYVGAEGEVVSQAASPFLVSVPMTNLAELESNDPAQPYDPATAWQYDITVYPKNATTSVTKKIIAEDNALVDRNDYEIADFIRQVIYTALPPAEDNKGYDKVAISDKMDPGLTYKAVQQVAFGAKVQNPEKSEDFGDVSGLAAEDYVVSVDEDEHGFKVELTASGLAKLNARKEPTEIVVFFDACLSPNAEIGPTDLNTNTPGLTWKHTNSLEKHVDGQKVQAFTYELEVTKTGPEHPEQAVFELSYHGAKDSEGKEEYTVVSFEQEEPGVYHVILGGDSTVYEVSPNAEGKLILKGLDSLVYDLKETRTQPGYNLLKEKITIDLTANDPLDGGLSGATATAGGKETALAHDNGVVNITVKNAPEFVLHTGGRGNGAYTIAGSAVLVLAAGLVIYRRRKNAA